MNIIPQQAIDNLELWIEGWVFDRAQKAEARRKLIQWMDYVSGFKTDEDAWSSSP